MSYIGYSDKLPVFTKIISLVNKDKENDALNNRDYFKYYNKICDYLNQKIDENDLIHFIQSNKFPIIKTELLIYNLNNLIKKNIENKKRLHKFISNNIHLFSQSEILSIMSLLFDDFLENYESCILVSNNFYISLFGIFVSSNNDEFLCSISVILRDTVMQGNEFYFLILFLSEVVDFDIYHKYLKFFVDYYLFYRESSLQSNNHLCVVIYEIFRIDCFFSSMWEIERKELVKNKGFVLNLLNLLILYHQESAYDILTKHGMDSIEDYFELMYQLLICLFEFEVDEAEYNISLNIYEYIILDYLEFDGASIKGLKNILFSILSQYLNDASIYFQEKSKIYDYNKEVILFYLFKKDYISLFEELVKLELVNYEFMIIVLKLIFCETHDNRLSYLLRFNDILINNKRLLNNNEIENVFNYILWILNDILKSYDNIEKMSPIILTVFKYSNFTNDNIYELINKIFDIKFKIKNYLPFEGKPFLDKLIENDGVIYRRLDREYIYIKNLFIRYSNEVLNERDKLIFYLENYLVCTDEKSKEYRIKYYEYILNLKYFDLYKFEVKNYFSYKKHIYEKLKSEIDFLIYDSANEEGFKLGVILSLLFKCKKYFNLYSKIINKVNWGDIYYEIYNIYGNKILRLDEIENHSCYIFRVKFKLRSLYGDKRFKNFKIRNFVIKDTVFEYLKTFTGKLNSYLFIYSIIFSNYYSDKTSSINVLTLNLRSIVKLINEDLNNEIIFDSYIYYKFMFYISMYCHDIVSYTQIQTLDYIKKSLKNKFSDMNACIEFKEIENFNNKVKTSRNINMEYEKIISCIDVIINGVKTSDYYNEIFYAEDIDLITSILNSETKFYNKEMELIYRYIKIRNFNTLNDIYLYSLNKPIIAKVFIKLLNNYPKVLRKTLNNDKNFSIYKKIVEII